MKVYITPHLQPAPHGLYQVLTHHIQLLRERGVTISHGPDSADLRVSHAGTSCSPDVAHLHGLYWTAHYDAKAPEYDANAAIIENIRAARAVTVPSHWVALTLMRDMHLVPEVLPHGVDWGEWQHSLKPEGYVLWNKNRQTDVCSPEPVEILAERVPHCRFVSTFGVPRHNLEVTGVLPYDKMKPLVQQAGVYLATTKETFGIGTLEAMAAGVPILGWKFGGTAELVEHEVSGYLAEPENYDELIAGLQYCLKNRAQLSEGAREAAKRWTWDSVGDQLLDIYRRVLKPELPTVAVIIPCHNYAGLLPRAVNSALAQTWQLVTSVAIVDDCSTDDTPEVAARLVEQDSRVQYIRVEFKNVALARNTGIAKTDAKYICCLDADDYIEPTFVETCVKALEEEHALGLAYTGLKIIGNTRAHSWPEEWDFDLQYGGKNRVPTCCIFRRDIWGTLGGYRARYCPGGAGSEDAEFWLRIGNYGWGGKKVTDDPLFCYRLGGGNTQRKDYREVNWTSWRNSLPPFASWVTPANRKKSHPVRCYDQPQVGVIIPVGDGHEDYLVDAVDSLEAQTYPFWEAIVVDDTTTQELRQQYQRSMPFALFIATGGARGPAVARNAGVEASGAPYVAFLDADDMLYPDGLRVFRSVVDEQTWVYPDVMVEEEDGSLTYYRCSDWDVGKLWRSGVGPVTGLYPRWMLLEVPFVDGPREDWELHLALAAKGMCGYHIPEPLLYYRHKLGKRQVITSGPAIVQSLREKYPLEVLQMACGGCSKRRKQSVAQNWQDKADAGFVALEFTGGNTSEITFRGKTGRHYRFAQGTRQWVHPVDAVEFLKRGYFRRVGDAQSLGGDNNGSLAVGAGTGD